MDWNPLFFLLNCQQVTKGHMADKLFGLPFMSTREEPDHPCHVIQWDGGWWWVGICLITLDLAKLQFHPHFKFWDKLNRIARPYYLCKCR